MNRTPMLPALLLALAAGLSSNVWAQSAPPVPAAGPGAQAGMPHGPGGQRGEHRQHGPRAQGGRLMGGPVMMLLGPGLDRALDVAKATPQQRADIRRIAGAARDDLRAAREQMRRGGAQPREAWIAAWSAERLDAGALEAERQRQANQREATAKRALQAAVEIGQVLQPEQRRALAEHWRRMRPEQRRAEAGWDLEEHAAAVVD